MSTHARWKPTLFTENFFEFERMCFEMGATIADIESATDVVNASQMRKDVVSTSP